ncbi:HAMP domain-containing sensor histidine kinase [Bdellovibrio sp. KM01]|uniref:sensor histidine kinase n=1 Tax=Bdellovibrio sp. KM01 TaxID=2748865 RepID=UPI0015EA34E9|nr:HAMP domain-containing sensor histidine kinase [Bdellovibrio sp. KM01]QLY23908.1 HAMP domain-containing histidine kinase [Bdellovibrio sp. KM01]
MNTAIKLKEHSKVRQAAHDIRSPLSALNILVKTCGDSLSEDAKALLEASIKRINEIAADLLAIEESSQESSVEITNDKGMTGVELQASLQGIVNEKRVQTQCEVLLHANLRHVSAGFSLPRSYFERIVSNLVDNSIQAMGERAGRIQIMVTENIDGSLSIQVQDNGSGIPSHRLPLLGRKGATFRKGGTGLGLYHAKTVINHFGGEMGIISEEGVGTMIKIKLPRRLS